ncbi:MAG: arginine--tRNA ligase [Alphaproteobacteria bacterium]|nr:arginine--tRNA ligase [Alphaproteobacteria bacterium]
MAVTPLLEQLSTIVGEAFAQLGYPAERGKVVISTRWDLAQFQCNGAMAVAKEAKKNPLEIAEAVAKILFPDTRFARVAAVAPGFLNIDISDKFFSAHVQAMAQDEHFGGFRTDEPLNIILDYCGPNVAKPMHVGHLRSSVIGNSLYRIFKRAGHRVTSDIHLGDWGLPMGMLIAEIKRTGRTEPVTLEELEVMYPKAAAECKEDPAKLEEARAAVQALQDGNEEYRALWRHFVDVSVKKVIANLERLDIDFDLWLGESDVQNVIPPMVEELKGNGKAIASEGAWIVEVAEPTDKNEIPPMLLVKSDGAALYSTTDLATIKQRVEEYNPDLILYVVDQRQHLHFEQVFRAARKVGYAGKAKLEHKGYGTVNGKDGKPFKTRTGGVMKLEDLIQLCVDAAGQKEAAGEVNEAEAIGIAALKFADLSSTSISGYVFDVDKFVSTEGKTGPYLQYACVRVHSLMEKSDIPLGRISLTLSAERALAHMAIRFPNAMREAIDAREPSILCEFAYELAQAFSKFYAACPIAKAEDATTAASRLGLAKLVHGQISACLDMLGIRVPERM